MVSEKNKFILELWFRLWEPNKYKQKWEVSQAAFIMAKERNHVRCCNKIVFFFLFLALIKLPIFFLLYFLFQFILKSKRHRIIGSLT